MFAYFDETGMHATASDVVVAGYLLEKQQIREFCKSFNEKVYPLLPVSKKGKRIFHASKCCPLFGSGEYQSLRPEDRQHIADLIAEAAVGTVTLGCVVGMEKAEYVKAVRNSPMLASLSGSEYTVCLVRCLENMAAWLDREKMTGRIKYIFEAGCEHQEEANQFLFRIAQSEELKKRYRLHNYEFTEKDSNVPELFAADLLAWEWQRWRANQLNPKMNESRPRLSKMLTAKPHIKEYMTEISLGIRALINVFYSVSSPQRPLEISNPFFKLKDFDNGGEQ